MTNEEAIKIIKSECYTANLLNLDRTRMVNTALDLAIKALEQQSRDCKTCKHSDNGNCAGTEECHECMWESKYDQQPCEDCISRADVLALAEKGTLVSNGNYKSVCKAINDLPSVTPKYTDEEIDKAQAVEQAYIDKMVELAVEELKTPKTEWIPVSESLPEDYIHVLCQFYLGGMGECYLAHGAFHVVGGLVMTCNEVVAWMPLPQPYNAESEG